MLYVRRKKTRKWQKNGRYWGNKWARKPSRHTLELDRVVVRAVPWRRVSFFRWPTFTVELVTTAERTLAAKFSTRAQKHQIPFPLNIVFIDYQSIQVWLVVFFWVYELSMKKVEENNEASASARFRCHHLVGRANETLGAMKWLTAWARLFRMAARNWIIVSNDSLY